MMGKLPAPFCGRDAQIALVSEQLDRARAGVGTVVLVEGGAGMGKTRLLDELSLIARRLGFRVGSDVADPSDSMVELSTLMGALFDGRDPILDRGALSDQHAPLEQRYWLLQDIQTLLERAALETPLLLCLDDIQWTDSGTAAALRALPNHLATVPICWVLAFRPHVGSRQLQSALEYLERSGAQKVIVGPLDNAAVKRVTAGVLLGEPDVGVLKMADRAGGSPFLLVELLSGLSEEHLVQMKSGHVELMAARLPQRVGESMRRRLDRMSDSARQVAAVAAGLGRRFSLDDLASMLDRPPSALLAAVDEALQSDLLMESGEKLAFRHDLIREAVRASVPPSVRRGLDRQAATVLLAAGALPVEVATQLAVSAEPGDEVAIATLAKAAEALGTTDPDAAADLSQRALELAPRFHPLRGSLVTHTAIWLHAAARGETAKVFADTALRQVLPPEQEAEVRLSIAAMFAISPDVRAESCRTALSLPNLSADIRALLLASLFHNLITAGRWDQARPVLKVAKDAVDQCQNQAGQFVVKFAESGLDYADFRFGPALERVEGALRSGIATGEDTRLHLATQWHCDVLATLDRLDESLQISIESIAAAQRDRQSWALNLYEAGRGRQLLRMGRLPDAAAALGEIYTPDIAQQVVNVLDAAGVGALGRVAIHMGDRRLARDATEIAKVMLEQGVPSVRRHAAWLLTLHAMSDGDLLRAHEWLCALGVDERTLILPLFPMDVADEARLVSIALAAHDQKLAEHAAATAQRRSQLNSHIRSTVAAAAHATGLLHHSHEDLARAVELYEDGPRPLTLASALEDLAAIAVESGRTQEGIDAFSRALSIYVGTGAGWDAGRVRGRLRSLGVRRRLVSTRRPDGGWAAMTDSELAVARLVAGGLTNREVAERLFVSPHTVNSHLRHVFGKLNVNSRVELARLAADHDPSRGEPAG